MTFRHFVGIPGVEHLFCGQSASMSDERAAVNQRMAKLARRLSLAYQWSQTNEQDVMPWENPGIPSGYAYLAQLIALFFLRSSPTLSTSSSGWDSALSLASIYDGVVPSDRIIVSPLNVASAFSLNKTVDFDKMKKCIPSQISGDSTVIKLVSLFQSLHKKAVALLEDGIPIDREYTEKQRKYSLNMVARVLCENTFRLIVRFDFLPRILHPEVLELYNLPGTIYLDIEPYDGVPEEFIQAFSLSLSYAMMRPRKGEVRETGCCGAVAAPWLCGRTDTFRSSAIESNINHWSKFFPMGGSRPELSRRVGPDISQTVSSADISATIEDSDTTELLHRELMSSVDAGSWSVPALIQLIRERRSEVARLSPLLWDDRERTARLAGWLRMHQTATGLTDNDVMALALDPPLIFYVLFEAAYDTKGAHLGVLGSLIVAEVLFRALKIRRFPGALPSNGLKHSFEDLAMIAFGRNEWAIAIKRCAAPVRSMPELISYLSRDV